MADNESNNLRTRHISIRARLLQNRPRNAEMRFVKTGEQKVDMFTKALGKKSHAEGLEKISLRHRQEFGRASQQMNLLEVEEGQEETQEGATLYDDVSQVMLCCHVLEAQGWDQLEETSDSEEPRLRRRTRLCRRAMDKCEADFSVEEKKTQEDQTSQQQEQPQQQIQDDQVEQDQHQIKEDQSKEAQHQSQDSQQQSQDSQQQSQEPQQQSQEQGHDRVQQQKSYYQAPWGVHQVKAEDLIYASSGSC